MAIRDVHSSRSDKDFVPDDAGQYAESILNIIQRMKTGYWPHIGVDVGWYKLITEVDEAIAFIAPSYHVDRVAKENGTLAYYISNIDDDVRQLRLKAVNVVARAQEVARITCEKCGAEGEQTRDGMSVLCSLHTKR